MLKQLRLLGKVMSEEGITTDPELVEDIINFPTPRTTKQVKRFVAMITYYSHFIDKFQLIVKPLLELTKKEIEFCWGDNHQQIFEMCKQLMLQAPILAHPDWN